MDGDVRKQMTEALEGKGAIHEIAGFRYDK